MSFLENKTIIITGASSGIGHVLAIKLAERKVNLVLNARTESALDDTAAACKLRNVKATVVAGDAASGQLVSRMVKEARSLGNFAGFVHAAGVLHPGPAVWEMTKSQFMDVINASYIGAYQLIRHAVPELQRSGSGVAVFFGSGAAEIVQPGIGAYCAAKAAEEKLAQHLAEEDDTVATIIYRPGKVETQMQEQARNAKGAVADRLRPLFRSWKEQGDLITPEESAEYLVQLLDDPRPHHGKTLRPD